jgi:hypothetical protein
MLLVASICQRAFVFVIKEATVADTRPAGATIEFVAVANLVPALSAFYGSIDQLKHRKIRPSEPPFKQPHPCHCGTCRLARHQQVEQWKKSVHR